MNYSNTKNYYLLCVNQKLQQQKMRYRTTYIKPMKFNEKNQRKREKIGWIQIYTMKVMPQNSKYLYIK